MSTLIQPRRRYEWNWHTEMSYMRGNDFFLVIWVKLKWACRKINEKQKHFSALLLQKQHSVYIMMVRDRKVQEITNTLSGLVLNMQVKDYCIDNSQKKVRLAVWVGILLIQQPNISVTLENQIKFYTFRMSIPHTLQKS